MLVTDEIKIIAKDLYNELGEGYQECIYHKAFEVGLRINNINYESKSIIPVFYKGYNVCVFIYSFSSSVNTSTIPSAGWRFVTS
jgi:GxxExxY protein